MRTFPINLVLQERLVVLIGGKGEIAGKAPLLLEAGARVRVIAPSVARVNPSRHLIRVVLPDPFGPITMATSPGTNRAFTPRKAHWRP